MHETTEIHTRIMRCALQVEDSRAFWSVPPADVAQSAGFAFEHYWFGGKSLARTKVLLANFHARYSAFPAALSALQRWPAMPPEARRLVCHWHLQLTDPLYRSFTGEFLPARLASGHATMTFAATSNWVDEFAPPRWQKASKRQVAGKLLSAAKSAGLVGSSMDPRPIRMPRVPDIALEYLLYLLRSVEFADTLIDNPYLRSVGLQATALEGRLKSLSVLTFRRQGDLVDMGWQHPDLSAWATARFGPATKPEA